MKPIPNGARGRYVHRVEPAHLANTFKDSILPPVFSTPYLILIMENAALNAIRQYLESGESAVGTRVDVRHLIATPVGREVVGHAEVTGSDGRQIFFRVTLPLLRPTILIVLIIRAVDALRSLELVFMMTKGGPAGDTEVLPWYLYTTGFLSLDLGYAAAMAVLMLALVTALSQLFVRRLESQETAL